MAGCSHSRTIEIDRSRGSGRRVLEGAGGVDVGVARRVARVAVVELRELKERFGDAVPFEVFEAPGDSEVGALMKRRLSRSERECD